MCILHQYHKASGLKSCTVMCHEREEFLGNFPYGSDHRTIEHSLFCKFLEGIWNNYVDIQQKSMQVRFIMILHAWGYNTLTHPTLRSTYISKYKLVNTISWFRSNRSFLIFPQTYVENLSTQWAIFSYGL